MSLSSRTFYRSFVGWGSGFFVTEAPTASPGHQAQFSFADLQTPKDVGLSGCVHSWDSIRNRASSHFAQVRHELLRLRRQEQLGRYWYKPHLLSVVAQRQL